MPEVARVEEYFTRAATSFDSLYDAESASRSTKWMNRTFRRDIYERFRLSLDHVRTYRLEAVLDVGCGPGRYELGLAEAGVRRIVGIDVSPGMIELARELTSNSTRTFLSLEFVQQDFATFQTGELFDAAVAMGFFDYVQDPAPLLQKMRRIATHSVIASFPSISWYRTPIRKVRYFAKRCPVYFYKPVDIDLLAKRAGFAGHEIRKIEGAGQDYFVTFFS